MTIIYDGDYPMATGAIFWDRDLTLSIEEIRATPDEYHNRKGEFAQTNIMSCLPEMRKGGIAAATVKICVCVRKAPDWHGEVRSKENAYAMGMGQLAYYRILEARGEARILDNKSDFTDHFQGWLDNDDHSSLPIGFVIGMEGADAITWPEQVHEWYDLGLRVVSLSHYGVSYYSHGTGTGTDGGLTAIGKPLLREMDSLGMILDVSHTSDQSVREELEVFGGPVLASHQNCRALVPGERQQPDELLKEIINRDGVIGASMDTWMLNRNFELDWADTSGTSRRAIFPREAITLNDLVDHMDHVNQLAGNSRHSSIGGDTDGQGGTDGAPADVDTVNDYQIVGDILADRGYGHDDIDNMLYQNWKRFFEKWLPVKI